MRRFTSLFVLLNVILVTTRVANASVIGIELPVAIFNSYLILWAIPLVLLPIEIYFIRISRKKKRDDERVIKMVSNCMTMIVVAIVTGTIITIMTISSFSTRILFSAIILVIAIKVLMKSTSTIVRNNGEVSVLSVMGIYVFIALVGLTFFLM